MRARERTAPGPLRSLGRRRLSERGFTLTELLVVIALIAMISFLALPSVSSYFRLSLNASAREMATVVKESYNSAVMTGRVHRVVYDFKEQSYWVETGPNAVLLDTAESKEKEERRKRFSDKNKEAPSSFALDKTVTPRKKSLPRGVEYTDVATEGGTEPISAGRAYTHMFPHGVTEQTIIHLKDTQNHEISLVISALVGRTRLLDGYVKKEDAYAQ